MLAKLPDTATWDDLIHEIHARQVIKAGLEDSEADRTIDVRGVSAKYGLSR